MNKRRLYIVFYSAIILLCIHLNVSAQVVKARVNRDKILIGEKILLKLAIENGKAGINWFRFPDSLNHLEVTSRSKIDTILNGNYTNYYQTISITSFDSGTWVFPPLSLAGINQQTPPINITVTPVDISRMEDYNDIKDIEDEKQQNSLLITAIIAAVTLLSIGIIYWLLTKNKKAAPAKQSLKDNKSPLEWALIELDKLTAKKLQTPAEVKKYYSDLTNISHTFFDLQLHQQNQHQTTEEWMLQLQPLTVSTEIKTPFFQFLRLSDTVKFAKYLPPQEENQTSVEAIKQMLRNVSSTHSNLTTQYQPK